MDLSKDAFDVGKTFEALGLRDVLCDACAGLEWKIPTKIQSAAIPPALEGKDVVGLAQTGSGKTAAFVLPILQSLLENPSPLFALILTPTRELAHQINKQVFQLGARIGIQTVTITGGITVVKQAIELAKKPHIIVGTPGRVLDHLQNTKGFSLERSLKYLVLDEADKLLSMDFADELKRILQKISANRQTMLFSATMTHRVEKLKKVAVMKPVMISVNTKYETVDTLKQYYLFFPANRRDAYLAYILTQYPGSQIIVFLDRCVLVQKMALVLKHLGFHATPLHSKLTQATRLANLDSFSKKHTNVLVCTDVGSRGLDLPKVDLVVNYDIPLSSKTYIHRVGRTARAGQHGSAITMVTQYNVEYFQRIEKYIGKKMEEYEHDEDLVTVLTERVTEAQRSAAIEMKETGGYDQLAHRKRMRSQDSKDHEGSTNLNFKSNRAKKRLRKTRR